ncbi:MAG TPA: gamma-glutamyl-gamma-aminobutyrate hydrolase family protein [Propionibacteriaceae bacterium]
MTSTAGERGRRPLIGLTTYREVASWGVWEQPADLLPAVYARCVEAAGGIAVLLPPQYDVADGLVARLDGLVVSGGADVDPARYGDQPHPLTGGLRPDRDGWELALLAAAEQAELPTLGICRGMQLMAVHGGGALQQHVPDVVGHDEHSPGGDAFGWIAIDTVAESRVRRMVGDHVQVSCHHHQSVVSHPGFVASARAADGTVEAIENPDRPFWLAVQWHPENGDDYALFRGLIEAATSSLVAS